jgi:hypothetical protein
MMRKEGGGRGRRKKAREKLRETFGREKRNGGRKEDWREGKQKFGRSGSWGQIHFLVKES